jgi:hypothetical protein
MAGLASTARRTTRVIATLATDVIAVLVDEPLGLPADAIARRLHRRRSAELALLRCDASFVHEGSTCGSRWRLAVHDAPQTPRDGTSGDERGQDDLVIGRTSAA